MVDYRRTRKHPWRLARHWLLNFAKAYGLAVGAAIAIIGFISVLLSITVWVSSFGNRYLTAFGNRYLTAGAVLSIGSAVFAAVAATLITSEGQGDD